MNEHQELRRALQGVLGAEVVELEPVRGGDVNDAYRAWTAEDRSVFVKTSPRAPAGSLRAEADGLAWLASAGAIALPSVVAVVDGPDDRLRALVLDWIEAAAPAHDFDEQLGAGLAALHSSGAPRFGVEPDPDGGSQPGFLAGLALSNRPCDTWAEFYVTRRLEPLLRDAIDAGRLPRSLAGRFGRLFERMHDLAGDPEPPARLHGDCWAGNVMADERGAPCLVDPAPYGGHREIDLAMLRLFGGAGGRVFEAYELHSPLAEGWRDRVALNQLWPLLVHVVLFGGGYADALERALGAYV
ncbi:MAG: fructosamine kinase family protein [Acidimicrobiia bacterium]